MAAELEQLRAARSEAEASVAELTARLDRNTSSSRERSTMATEARQRADALQVGTGARVWFVVGKKGGQTPRILVHPSRKNHLLAVLSLPGHNNCILSYRATVPHRNVILQAELDAARTQLAERSAAAEAAQTEAATATTALARLKQTHTAFKEEHADMKVRCEAAVVTAAAATADAAELVALRAKHEDRAVEMAALQSKLEECVTRSCFDMPLCNAIRPLGNLLCAGVCLPPYVSRPRAVRLSTWHPT